MHETEVVVGRAIKLGTKETPAMNSARETQHLVWKPLGAVIYSWPQRPRDYWLAQQARRAR
jgi:hypothetical protein